MMTFDLPLLSLLAFDILLLVPPAYGIPSLSSSKNAFLKNDFGYYPPAELDYPPMTPYPPPAKLPPSSKLDFENDELTLSKNPKKQKIYGDGLLVRISSVPHPDHFNNNDGVEQPHLGDISNPARYYLLGAHFDEIKSPRCRLISCHGPYPNDGSLLMNKDVGRPNEQCEQTFVQMNSCVADKGYPVGMVCTICCQCTKEFINEMYRSRGFQEWIN